MEFGNCDKQSSSIGSLIRADFTVVVVGVTSSVLILSLNTFRCTQSFCTISTTITIKYLGIKEGQLTPPRKLIHIHFIINTIPIKYNLKQYKQTNKQTQIN